MPRLSLLSLLALVALSACEGTSYAPPIVQLVDGNGTHPFRGMDGVLQLTIAQEGEAPEMEIEEIRAGDFLVDVQIADYELRTEVQATIIPDGTSPELIGATTIYRPINFGNGIRIVMGPRATCVALTEPRLSGARILPGLAFADDEGTLLQIGGARSGAAVSSIEVFYAPLLTVDLDPPSTDPLEVGFGRTLLRRLAGTRLFFAVDETHAIVYDTTATTPAADRVSRAMLHGGSGLDSAVTDLGTRGIAVVGGLSGVDRSRDVTVVRDRSTFDRLDGNLMVGRSGASAVPFSGGMLVAGGQADGAPLFEWTPLGAPGTPSAFGDTAARSDGVLVVDGNTAFYYLGRDDEGALVESSWIITGCPTTCTATAGPLAPSPRFDPATAARAEATVVLGGEGSSGPSRAVEEIVITGADVSIVPMGDLTEPRADTTALAVGGGMVLVAGGRGADRELDSMELCFPQELDPFVVDSL